MFRSNSKYYVKSTISASQSAGSTFTISPDFELWLNLETGTDNVSIVLQSNTQIERMTITATGGVATIVQRWLDQSATKTPVVWLQKQWNDGTIMYIAALAPDMLDIDMSSGSASISTPTVYTNSLSATKNQQIPTFANTGARDAAITSPANGYVCFVVWVGEQVYSGWAWTTLGVGSPTPFASTTVAGSVEIATSSETKSGTDTGWTGALLWVLPSDIAKNTQSSTFVYGHSTTGTDTYTVWLTPALTTYTTWMKVRVLFDTSNTWACSLNIDSLGAKNIKLIDWTDPLDWDITATRIYDLTYDGTNFVLQTVPVRATTSDATTGTNTVKFMTPSTTKDSIKDSIGVITTWLSFGVNTQASTSWIVAWYVRKSWSTCRAECFVWASNPAWTLVQKSWSTSQDIYWAFSFPVKKWYYWRVDAINSPDESTLTFTPNA